MGDRMFYLVDAHADTFVKAKALNADIYDNNIQISIKKLQKFNNSLQFFALCLADTKVPDSYHWYLDNLNFYLENLNKYSEYMAPVKVFSDIEKNNKDKKISSLLAIEGAEVLRGSTDRLYEAYEKGVRSINLTWNNNNELGCSSMAEVKEGLTDKGKEFLKIMNDLGIIADVSHLSEKGFWDICELSTKPFIASHSNSYTVCKHPRNLSDDQLKALGEKNGVAGLNLCDAFLREGGYADMDDLIKHLEAMLNLAGEDHVGLGCDLDGIGPHKNPDFEIKDVSNMDLLYERCSKEFGKNTTEKIFSLNFLKVMKDIMK